MSAQPLELEGAPVARCVRCDHPHPCPDHPGGHYYEDGPAPRGTAYDAARERWRLEGRGPWARPGQHRTPAHTPATLEPAPLEQLVHDLGPHVYVDADLERALRAAHAADALRTTKLVEHVIAQTVAGRLSSPGGLLWTSARDIAHRPEPDSS